MKSRSAAKQESSIQDSSTRDKGADVPVTVDRETQSKINSIKTKLAEMKAYKGILAEDGLTPDLEDKERESRLIVQLLRLEKGLTAKAPAGKKRGKGKATSTKRKKHSQKLDLRVGTKGDRSAGPTTRRRRSRSAPV